MEDFFKQNISWQRITEKNQFCLTEPGMLILDSMAFLTKIDNYKEILLSVLNSNVIYFWLKKNVHEYGASGFRLSNQYVEEIPVPKIINYDLNQLINERLSNNFNHLTIEKIINQIVYNIYGLSRDEIDLIEGI